MFDLPLEYALIGFEDDKFSGKIVPELLDLAERGIVRFVDIVFIQKEADGSTRTIELNDLDPEVVRDVRTHGRARFQPLYERRPGDGGEQASREFGGDALVVGEPVGCRSAQGHRGCRRPTGGARPNCARSGRAVQAGTRRGITQARTAHRSSLVTL